MNKIDREALKKSIQQKKNTEGKIIFKTCDDCFVLDCECLKAIREKV